MVIVESVLESLSVHSNYIHWFRDHLTLESLERLVLLSVKLSKRLIVQIQIYLVLSTYKANLTVVSESTIVWRSMLEWTYLKISFNFFFHTLEKILYRILYIGIDSVIHSQEIKLSDLACTNVA